MSALKQWLKRHRAWVLVGLTVLFVVVVRVRLREMPLERDEGEYAYAGQLLLHGVPPYKEVYNMKLPGTYAAYALVMAVFGQTPAGIHFGVMLVNAGAIVLMFLLGRRLLDEAAGVVAAVVYALMSLSPAVLGLAGHATHFVVLPALGGMILLMRSAECGVRSEEGRTLKSEIRNPKSETNPKHQAGNDKNDPVEAGFEHSVIGALNLFRASSFGFRIWASPARRYGSESLRLFASGLLFGLAFLMKQHGIFFGVFGVLYLLWTRFEVWRAAREAGKGSVRELRQLHEFPASTRSPIQKPAARLSHFAAGMQRNAELPNAECGMRNAESEGRNAEEETSKRELRTSNLANAECGGRRAEEKTPNLERRTSDFGLRPSFGPRPSAFGLLPALALFTAGFVLPYALTCLALWLTGALRQFVFWTISYAAEYASANAPVNGPELLKAGLRSAVGPTLPFWLLPWLGALVMWWEHRFGMRNAECGMRISESHSTLQTPQSEVRSPKSEVRIPQSAFRNPHSVRFFLTALLFCSFASASVGFYFREHYFIVVLPVLALLSGVAVSRGLYLVKHDRTIELFLAAPILLLFVAGCVSSLIGSSVVWFASSAQEAHRQTYLTTLFTQAAAAADYIKGHTAKNARIAVLGSEPEVFFLSDRRSATGYIYMYPLMEDQPYALKMQEELIGEIERGRPEYVVYVADDSSWARYARSRQELDEWWGGYWVARYDLVMTLEVKEGLDGAPDSRNGDVPPKTGPPKQLLLLKRKG